MSVTATRSQEILDRLAKGIGELTSSDAWRRWLDVQRRFNRYSFSNALLISLQRPDATRVAGFHARRGIGRAVRKGERGIAILAPCVYRRAKEDEAERERRSPESRPSSRQLAVADVVLNEATHEVWRAGELVEMTRTEFGLLAYLTANAGHVVTRRQLLDHGWDHDPGADEESFLEVYMWYLRGKVDPGEQHADRGGARDRLCGACDSQPTLSKFGAPSDRATPGLGHESNRSLRSGGAISRS